MNAYAVLGISTTASIGEAKAAYRKLAQQHHPDKGGSEAKFKEIKAAWEAIESGRASQETPKPADAKPYKSSFSDAPKASRKAGDPFKESPKPAPGYEPRGPRPMPVTRNIGTLKEPRWEVSIEISPKHAFKGCTVPFVHQGMVLEHTIRPGASDTAAWMTFVTDETIGSITAQRVSIFVRLSVVDRRDAPKTEPPKNEQPTQETKDDVVTVKVCAIGLFSGGKLEPLDNRKEPVHITIPPGYDPSQPIIAKGRGFGPDENRGDLIIKIEPVFKAPKTLSATEKKMLERVVELAK